MAKTPASAAPGSRRKPPGGKKPPGGRKRKLPVIVLAMAVGGGIGLLASWVIDHIDGLNEEIATLQVAERRATDEARDQSSRADAAERTAREASAAREQAETDADAAREEAADADERAATAIARAADVEATSLAAQAEARRAQEEAEATRQAAEREMNRLNEALGRIAETRRTALGLVMNLDEGSLRFDFNRADLRPESRETLALIAGILFTSEDFAITISGHTDARGNRQYNQRLSERRARAVADFLIEAGLAAERFTVEGLGEAHPLDTGNSDAAHARNRRVELGIVSARIIDPSQIDP